MGRSRPTDPAHPARISMTRWPARTWPAGAGPARPAMWTHFSRWPTTEPASLLSLDFRRSFKLRQTWRWFGPKDLTSIDDITQVGAVGVVSALHHVPNGVVWTPEEIAKRHQEIATRKDGTASGLTWDVVESLPVSEDIKKQKGDWREHIANYKVSMKHLADSGIETICYNFMPVLDWTRTDLRWTVAHGGSCMRFDINDFAAFDIHILQRPGAAADFTNAIADEAGRRFETMDEDDKKQLARNVTMGLPGSTESMTLTDVQAHLDEYGAISR